MPKKKVRRSLLCIHAHATFVRPAHQKGHPNALAPNNTLGLPELLTITNAPFKFASLLS
jgi:hypothetical protein